MYEQPYWKNAITYVQWLVKKANARGCDFEFNNIPGKGYAFKDKYTYAFKDKHRDIYVYRNAVCIKGKKDPYNRYEVFEIRKIILGKLLINFFHNKNMSKIIERNYKFEAFFDSLTSEQRKLWEEIKNYINIPRA